MVLVLLIRRLFYLAQDIIKFLCSLTHIYYSQTDTGIVIIISLSLAERVGAEVVECACVIELPELKVCYQPLRLQF